MHDPIGFGSFRGFTDVKHQSFLDANFPTLGHDIFVRSGGLPVPGAGNSIGSRSVWVLPISRTEKVPFFFPKYRFT